MNTFDFYATKLVQPIGEFFVGVLPAAVLMRTAEPEPRRLVDPSDEENQGIQRALNDKRVSEIREYLATVDASFPNSIILSLSDDALVDGPTPTCVDGKDVGLHKFRILEKPTTFSVIDGQHRLKGFDENTSQGFDLIVTIFLGLEEEEKAYLFSTINSTQTKVSKSLVYDLFDVARTRSPQRSAHVIAKAMNADPKSPFFKRIKLLGTNPRFGDQVLYKGNLSQGTFVERLLRLITSDPAADRDAVKRNLVPAYDLKAHVNLVFRKLWIEGEDAVILRILMNYFSAFASVFSDEWQDSTSPLAKTIGFGALMRLLVPLVKKGMEQKDLSVDFFDAHVNRLHEAYRRSGVKVNFDNFPAAGNGETKLYQQLLEWSRLG